MTTAKISLSPESNEVLDLAQNDVDKIASEILFESD